MIFYFSGTGNSLHIAEQLAKQHNERLISVAEHIHKKNPLEFTLREDERIGFVFPIYAWAPPRMLMQFIQHLTFTNYANHYTFAVATCGANIGNALDVLAKALKKRNVALHSGFSIAMPNNYILLGDIDSPEIIAKKLQSIPETLAAINEYITARQTDVFKAKKGFFPSLLTTIINPLFNSRPSVTKKFYATDACTGCAKCEKVCNARPIKVQQKPTWGLACTMCLACIHVCPVQAIQYGKATQKKGRYINPNIKVNKE